MEFVKGLVESCPGGYYLILIQDGYEPATIGFLHFLEVA
jgi:hypothetical protein